MSWPVSNTPVFEPTESESLEELDRFYGALVEIAAVERGERPREGNVLKMVPHTAKDLMRVDWDRPYSRGETAFPQPWLREKEFWPRVDEVGCWQAEKRKSREGAGSSASDVVVEIAVMRSLEYKHREGRK
uniref:Glycine dehydrogenase C-terminal domain-containing protein n=1 Tax=Physcomitrium patens TaxID=3218 RepID=A0A2K1JM02_PHYPA|nr:hypothetical protein PHYPA_017391 [Physcomitrium patens]